MAIVCWTRELWQLDKEANGIEQGKQLQLNKEASANWTRKAVAIGPGSQ